MSPLPDRTNARTSAYPRYRRHATALAGALVVAAVAGCATDRDARHAAPAVNATAEEHARAFARLASLAGEHTMADGDERSPVVRFRSIARGTALLEEWRWPSGAEELTVFFVDRGTLRATHYCHSGIQSTMTLQPAAPGGELVFRITSATNLPSPEVPHNTGFSYRFDDDGGGSVVRGEEWTAAGTTSRSADRLVRRAAPASANADR